MTDSTPPLVWLASYPRSGNTFLRTVLFQCFGLRSGSLYAKDFDERETVAAMAGHVEQGPERRIDLEGEPVYLVKTHGKPTDDRKAIYVLRDGRHAAISLFHFYEGKLSLERIASGDSPFGSWSQHVEAWSPRTRPDTLFLRYEDMARNIDATIDAVAGFLDIAPKTRRMPTREELTGMGDRWVRPPDAPREELSGPALELFWQVNGAVMREYGYEK